MTTEFVKRAAVVGLLRQLADSAANLPDAFPDMIPTADPNDPDTPYLSPPGGQQMLTAIQRQVLTGLSFGRASLSAIERGSSEIMELLNRDLAACWSTQHGDCMWEITAAGRTALTQARGGAE